MKRIFILLFLVVSIGSVRAGADSTKVALLLIDIQDFYFPGGASALNQPEEAGRKAKVLLMEFRKRQLPVIHIKHQFEPGGNINKVVKPMAGELVITKQEVSAFNGTDLLERLSEMGIKKLVIAGMQTHMCVEAAVRSAYDLGFKVILVGDACATKDLKFNEYIIKSKDVHASTLVTLRSYAEVVKAEEIEKCFPF